MKRIFYLSLMLVFAATSYAANPVVVDDLNTGDFTTISAAIASWCAGGSNSGETAPFVIQVINGPYDEEIHINQTMPGVGDIVGDMVITATGSPVTVKVQPFTATDQYGVGIYQDNYNVTLDNLILCPSATGPSPIGQFIRVGETGGAGVLNTVTISNCVVTESSSAGEPLVTSKLEALAATYPVDRSGKMHATAGRGVQKRGNISTSGGVSLTLDNTVIYGFPGVNAELYFSTTSDIVTINDCVNSHAGAVAFRLLGGNAGTAIVTGTDATAGPLSATVVLNANGRTNAPGGAISCEAAAGTTYAIDNVIIEHNVTDHSQPVYGIRCTGNAHANVSDSILVGSDYLLGCQPPNAMTVSNVTFFNLASAGAGSPLSLTQYGEGTGSLAITDCIFSGSGTALSGTSAAGGTTVDYSALVQEGPNALTAVDDGSVVYTATNTTILDPMYISTDINTADAFDVDNASYGGAGSAGSNLAGGADYVGSVPVSEWSLY